MGKIGVCDKCGQTKEIVMRVAEHILSALGVKSLCSKCLNRSIKYPCVICNNEVEYDEYEKHLLERHNKEAMAQYISDKVKETGSWYRG